MSRVASTAVASALLTFGMLGCSGASGTVAAIEKLGGKVAVDDSRPDRPVVQVDFSGTQVTDADLHVLEGLDRLQYLDLSSTKVTDAGLVKIKGLKSLHTLSLMFTPVTERGLDELSGLPNLRVLLLSNENLSRKGFERLMRTMPNVEIAVAGPLK